MSAKDFEAAGRSGTALEVSPSPVAEQPGGVSLGGMDDLEPTPRPRSNQPEPWVYWASSPGFVGALLLLFALNGQGDRVGHIGVGLAAVGVLTASVGLLDTLGLPRSDERTGARLLLSISLAVAGVVSGFGWLASQLAQAMGAR